MNVEVAAFERLDACEVARFRNVPSSQAANLCDRAGGLHHAIRRQCGAGIVVGSALTAQAAPGDNQAVFVALAIAQPGDLILLATGASEEVAVVGDRVAGMAANSGVVGIVTDGLVRDLAGMARAGLPVHARGTSPNAPRRVGPSVIGRPVRLGGVAIESGDLVVADAEGVAVVPRRQLGEALLRLAELQREEEAMDAAIEAGLQHPAWAAELVARARGTS
jgi:4-hydroxy-4-methyl-2-oxoglutarate aldolase